jgi:V8-like Glu-specific endopeptidase
MMWALILILAAAPLPPPTAAIVSVIGRFGMAQACPVAANLAITNAHVVDPFPTNAGMPLMGLRWDGGLVRPLTASSFEDLALLTPMGEPFPSWYPLAAETPAVGEELWWVGYDWGKRSRALTRRTFRGDVVAVVAGTISINAETPSGSSGSCVLNARGEVVAIIAWGREMDNSEHAAFAISVWGRWFDLAKALDGIAVEKAK